MNRCILAAATVDAFIGDPPQLPHPVRAIGFLISRGERIVRRLLPATPHGEALGGTVLAGAVSAAAVASSYALASMTRLLPPPLRWLEVVFAASTLAARDLVAHARRIEESLTTGNFPEARLRLGCIVGRDTEHLSQTQIVAAAIESLAESLCDGVVAPLFFLALGGLPAAMGYKAVNTLDSMIGHREAPYTTFGTFAARFDDVLNFVPARFAAAMLVLLAPCVDGSQHRAEESVMRDARRHTSPNAGYPEAAIAGALNVRLGGAATYDGVAVERAVFNAHGRLPQIDDLRAAIRLVVLASAVSALCASAVRGR